MAPQPCARSHASACSTSARPTPRQIEIARHCRAALKEIFLARPGGHADEAALEEIKELCLGALRAVDDPVCGGRLLTIHCCAAALYSSNAHRHWDRVATSGVDRLRQKIFHALNGYQRRLYQLSQTVASSPTIPAPVVAHEARARAQPARATGER